MSYSFNLKLTDHTDDIKKLTEEGIETLLEAIGQEAEGDVVLKISDPTWNPKEPIDTGVLKNSITHRVVVSGAKTSEHAVYVGTNVAYAPYVEFGTGDQGTHSGPAWTYRDDEGKFHRTSGMKARPFLRRGISENVKKYKEIAEDSLAQTFGD